MAKARTGDYTSSSCSPYEEILPIPGSLKATYLNPAEDNIWKVLLMPGTDNSFHQGNAVPSCFGENDKLEYLRQLDIALCQDSGAFAIKLRITTRENVGGFEALASILLTLKYFSGMLVRSEYDRLISKWNRGDVVGASAGIDLHSLYKIYLTTGLKSIDRLLLALYTGARSLMKLKTDEWVSARPMIYQIGGCKGTWAVGATYNHLGYNEGDYN